MLWFYDFLRADIADIVRSLPHLNFTISMIRSFLLAKSLEFCTGTYLNVSMSRLAGRNEISLVRHFLSLLSFFLSHSSLRSIINDCKINLLCPETQQFGVAIYFYYK